MNDINKLLDEIENLPDGETLSVEVAFADTPQFSTDSIKALATAYREQGEKLEKAIFYLESISGGWDPDWMLKRAYEGLAELGVKGYETNGQELRETTKVD
jgi:hypothetical protein